LSAVATTGDRSRDLLRWLKRRSRLIGVLIGLAVAALLIFALWVDVPFLAVWQRSLSDLLFIPQKPAERIVIVGVDDNSLTELGRWPWPRGIHARLLDTLSAAGAQAGGRFACRRRRPKRPRNPAVAVRPRADADQPRIRRRQGRPGADSGNRERRGGSRSRQRAPGH
jgi:CHASE2 domain-containing sensor protein